MKFTTFIFTLLGLLFAVAALPSPVHLKNDIQILDVTNQALDKRQAAEAVQEVVEVVEDVVKDVVNIVNFIKGKIEHDKIMRGRWTYEMVARFRQKHPHYNFVICHTAHKFTPKGKNWGHKHHEMKVSFGKTIGFDIYWFKEGAFKRIGDGGYLNWSYDGNVKSTSDHGKSLVFGRPP